MFECPCCSHGGTASDRKNLRLQYSSVDQYKMREIGNLSKKNVQVQLNNCEKEKGYLWSKWSVCLATTEHYGSNTQE